MDVEITREIQSEVYLQQDPNPILSLLTVYQLIDEINDAESAKMKWLRIPSTAGDALVRVKCIAAITAYVEPPEE